MLGIVKKKFDKGFGFILVDGFEGFLFFHSMALIGITFDELEEGDPVSFEIVLTPRTRASTDTVRNARMLLPYGEQKIVTPKSLEAVKLQKKATTDLIVHLSKNPTDLFRLSAKEFEELVAELYVIHGYTIEMLGSWNQGDGGVDILAMKCDIGTHQLRWAIQCKRYARGNLVSAAPIRALAGVLDRFQAHAGAIVTTSDFTKPAKKEAELYFWKVDLINFQSLVEMLRKAELLVRSPLTLYNDRTNASKSAAVFLTATNVALA